MTLSDFFAENSKIALAFSGGTDSSYLLYAATMNHADICAYYVKTPFQPQFELDDAKRLAAQLNAKMKIVDVEGLEFELGMAVTPLNIEEFDVDDSLIVDQMLEPIIMSREGLVKTGTVMLRKAKQ